MSTAYHKLLKRDLNVVKEKKPSIDQGQKLQPDIQDINRAPIDKPIYFDDNYIRRRLFNQLDVNDDEKRPNVIFRTSVNYLDFRKRANVDVDLELDQNEIVIVLRYRQEIEGIKQAQKDKVIFRVNLDQLYRVYVIAPFDSGELMLSFYDEKLQSYRDIDLRIQPKDQKKDLKVIQKITSQFIANLLQLREEILLNSQISTSRINQLQVLPVAQKPDHSYTIMGHLPVYDLPQDNFAKRIQESLVASEINLLQKLTKNIEREENSKSILATHRQRHENFEDDIIYSLRQIDENCNFFTYSSSSDADLRIVCNYTLDVIRSYGDLETQVDNVSVELHDSELDTNSEDELDEIRFKSRVYLDRDRQADSESDSERDVPEKRKQASEMAAEKLTRLMVVFQKLLQSKLVYESFFDLNDALAPYKDLTLSFIKLIKDENIFVAYQSSLCLSAIIRSQHDANRQKNNRHQLIKQIHIMKYLDRLMSYHDRYYTIKHRKEIFCPISLKIISDLLTNLIMSPRLASLSQNPEVNLENLFDEQLQSQAFKPELASNTDQVQPNSTDKLNQVDQMRVVDGEISSNIYSQDLCKVINYLFESQDFKLLHVLEQFSTLSDHLITSLAYSRILLAILQFCRTPEYDRNLQNQIQDNLPMTEKSLRKEFTFGHIQYRFFVCTIQLINCIKILMETKVLHNQVRVNAILIFNQLMLNNPYAVQVIKNVFPQFLLNEVKVNRSEQEIAETWLLQDWIKFFVFARKDFSDPLKIWNKESRIHLIQALSNEITKFKTFQEKNIIQDKLKNKYLSLDQPTKVFNSEGEIESNVKHLKWNFEEFKVNYRNESETNEGNYKLWKYHLKELLIDASTQDGTKPRLHSSLQEKDVQDLWRKLELEYVACFDSVKYTEKQANAKKTVLKCLILLYSNYSQSIGVFKTLPYWLRQLQTLDRQNCQFLVLQLIYTALSIPEGSDFKPEKKELLQRIQRIAIQNKQIFDQADGLRIVAGCLQFAFLDLSQDQRFKKTFEKLASEQSKKNKQEQQDLVSVLEGLDDERNLNLISDDDSDSNKSADFADLGQLQVENKNRPLTLLPNKDFEEELDKRKPQEPSIEQFQSDQSSQVNYAAAVGPWNAFDGQKFYTSVAIMAIRILDFVMKLPSNNQDYPMSQQKQQLLQTHNVAVLSSLLLVDSDQLTNLVLDFILQHLGSQYALFQFRKTGIVEFLIMLLDNRGLENRIAEASFQILLKLQEVILDYNDDFDIEKEIDKNDRKVIRAREEEAQKAQGGEKLSLLKSLFLRYLPLPMVVQLIESNSLQERMLNQSASEVDSIYATRSDVEVRKTHLAIYQSDKHERANLIWNSTMRDQLNKEILNNCIPYVVRLRRFVDEHNANLSSAQIQHQMPVFENRITKMIKYAQIEKEIRCGQYYLRIFADQYEDQSFKPTQKDSLTEAKMSEEQKVPFMKSLISTFQEVVDRFKEHNKDWKRMLEIFQEEMAKIEIIIKACLLAQQMLKINENQQLLCIICLLSIIDEIYNQIISQGYKDEDTLRDKETRLNFQRIIKLSLETINSAIAYPQEYDRGNQKVALIAKKSIEARAQQQEIEKKMEKADKTKKMLLDNQIDVILLHDQVINTLYMSQEGTLHKLAAQSLDFCAQNLQLLIFTDNNRFKEKYNTAKRLSLINKIVKMVGQSQLLLDLMQRKPAQQQIHLFDDKSSSKTRQVLDQKQTQSKPVPKMGLMNLALETLTQTSSSKTARDQALVSRSLVEDNKSSTANQSGLDTSIAKDEDFALDLTSEDVAGFLQYRLKQDTRVVESQQKKKAIITEKQIWYTLKLAKSAFSLGKKLSELVDFQTELIQSCFVWQALLFTFFSLQKDLIFALSKDRENNKIASSKRLDIEQIIADASTILINIYSLAESLTEANQPSENLLGDHLIATAKIIDVGSITTLESFLKVIQILLPADMLKLLDNQLNRYTQKSQEGGRTINLKSLRPAESRPQGFDQVKVNQFVKMLVFGEQRTPEFIWDDQMRIELQQALTKQLQLHFGFNQTNFASYLSSEFDYQVNKVELKVENIFVKYFNSDVYFQPKKPSSFVYALIQRLKEIFPSIQSQDEATCLDAFEMLKAIKNLIQYQKILDAPQLDFESLVSLLCRIIEMISQNMQSIRPLIKINNITFEVLELLTQSSRCEELTRSITFVLLLTNLFNIDGRQFEANNKTDDQFSLKNLNMAFQVIQSIFKYTNKKNNQQSYADVYNASNAKSILNDVGMVYFFLKVLLNRSAPNDARLQAVKILQDYIEIVNDTEIITKIGQIIPISFLDKMHLTYNSSDQVNKKLIITEFLHDFDSETYKNIFLMWSRDQFMQAEEKVSQICEKIVIELSSIKSKQAYNNYKCQVSVEPLIQPENCDVVVLGINTRVFNCDPSVLIPISFASFVEELSYVMTDYCVLLEKLINLEENKQEGDEHVTVRGADEDLQLNISTLEKFTSIVQNQVLQLITCLLLSFQQMMYRVNSSKIRETDLQLNQKQQQNWPVIEFIIKAISSKLFISTYLKQSKIMFSQLLFVTISARQQLHLSQKNDKTFCRAIIDYLKEAFKYITELSELEGSYIIMLYFLTISNWRDEAANHLWADSQELNDFVQLSKAKRYLRSMMYSLLNETAQVSVSHAQRIEEILQEEKTFSSNSILNESNSLDYQEDIIKAVIDVEQSWQIAPTRQQIKAEKDGKWWKPMEDNLDWTQFEAFRKPIISAFAIEESFQRLKQDESVQLELLKKQLRLIDEDF